MADPTGNKLFVNVSASQARKRLKGFGHGVRGVQSVGKNRAVIVHTATGRHREELEDKFLDVGHSQREDSQDEPVQSLRNLGPTSSGWLRDVGVMTRHDLVRLGPVFVYQMVRRREPSAGKNLLWALAAAIDDRDWRELSSEEKADLLNQLEA